METLLTHLSCPVDLAGAREGNVMNPWVLHLTLPLSLDDQMFWVCMRRGDRKQNWDLNGESEHVGYQKVVA